MADYKVEKITEVRVADEPTSVRVAMAAGAEVVVLAIDWEVASDLIDRMSVVNNKIRHTLYVPDWRAQRVRSGCHRAGVALAILLSLPALYALWLLAVGDLDAGGWKLIVGFLLAAPFAYGASWLIGWVVAGFVGKRERSPAPPTEAQAAG